MWDRSDRETEIRLMELEEKLKKIYKTAEKELKEKLEEHLNGYERSLEELKKMFSNKKITEKEYELWLARYSIDPKHTEEMIQVMTDNLYNANATASKMIRNVMPEVFEINANYAAFKIEKQIGFDTAFSLYNADAVKRIITKKPKLLPKVKVKKTKDIKYNQKKLRNEITQGILQGESIPKIAERLHRVVGMNENFAVTNARTAVTSAQNGGRMDTYQRAYDMGIDVKKVWLATVDGRTRSSHRLLDGQIQPLNKPFISEYGKIMQPGDPSARPEDVYNCRCRVSGVLKDSDFDPKDLSQRFTRIPKNMSYDDWKTMKDKKKVA